MLNKIKNNYYFKTWIDGRNIGLYILVIVALSVTWSSVKIIQKNYGLEKQITVLQQQVDVLDQQTKNQKLINEYYKTDAYLDLAVRKYFGKALPGEKLVLVPPEIALKYAHQDTNNTTQQVQTKAKPKYLQNLQDWVNFFTHHQQNG